jgi:hypothetical protein
VAEVGINKFGFVLINLYAKRKDTSVMSYALYKVDTGANLTTISSEKLLELGYDEDWIKSGTLLEGDNRPTLAAGEPVDDCYRVVLPEINIGGFVGYNWPFVTSPSASFRLLIGTDTMRFFNWVFDYENNVCRFDLIPGKRQLLFNQAEQSVHSVGVDC